MKFMEINNEYEKSKIILQGIPYDGTASYKPGTRFAPMAIRSNALIGYETYSPVLDKDLENVSFHDNGDLEVPYTDPKIVMDVIYKHYKSLLEYNKKIATIGGEHSITAGIIKAYSQKYSGLKVIHLDAHTDLREDYLGSNYSHASVMKRVCEYINPQNLYQFGVRSGTKEEFAYAKENINFYPYTVKHLEAVLSELGDDPVYITIDLDVLDPAFFPGTGTPEPDGITTKEFFSAIYKFQTLKNIVGFDIVELSPKIDSSEISTALAIKALREMLLII